MILFEMVNETFGQPSVVEDSFHGLHLNSYYSLRYPLPDDVVEYLPTAAEFLSFLEIATTPLGQEIIYSSDRLPLVYFNIKEVFRWRYPTEVERNTHLFLN